VRLAKIAQYIAIFRLAAVAPYLRTPEEKIFLDIMIKCFQFLVKITEFFCGGVQENAERTVLKF
jgi:hypothetical protein